jgi:hypothetical protein
MADQPHLQLLEFAVCSTAYSQFNEGELQNLEDIISGAER